MTALDRTRILPLWASGMMLRWSRSLAGSGAPFARYWLSGFLADFGDGVRLAAFPLLAAQITSSPATVAVVTAAQGRQIVGNEPTPVRR